MATKTELLKQLDAAPDLLEAVYGLLAHVRSSDADEQAMDADEDTGVCPLCGRPAPVDEDGAVDGPRAYHAICWRRVEAARAAITRAKGREAGKEGVA